MIINQQVCQYINSKFPYNYDIIMEGLEKGRIFAIASEGNEAQSQILERILIQNDFYEKPETKKAKQQAFLFLESIIEEWSLNIAQNEKKISKEEMSNYTARVLLFGSYVLGLNSNDSDVDVICVVPNFINREKHFFVDLAESFENHPGVKNLSRIASASVPIITFQYKGLPIDISFSQLNTQIVPKDIDRQLSDELIDSILDAKCKTSILGRKNNLMILERVKNQERLQSTLRLIKVWAKNRGISSNQMGYLGGISWAILVAKVCQVFPDHYPNKLLMQFFRLYSMWDWKNMPVKLVEMKYQKTNALMTVLTPGSAYNSTERINDITFKVLISEIHRARDFLERNEPKRIFERVDFINEYPLFIQIDIYGENTQPNHQRQYNEFKGAVESKLVSLISRICQVCKPDIEADRLRIVPYPRTYKKNDDRFAFDYCYFFGAVVAKDIAIDTFKAVQGWSHEIMKIKKDRRFLGVKIFETKKSEIEEDVEVDDLKRKRDEKERNDPRKMPIKMPNRADSESFKKFLK